MASFLHAIGVLAAHNPLLAYLGFYGGVILFGNLGIFAGLWFVTQGYLGEWGILFFILTVFVAEITGDLLWYSLGRGLRDTKLGTFLKNHLPRHEKLERHLEKNCSRWVFLSKCAWGTTFPVVFLVGWSKVDFGKFFKTSLFAIALAVPIVLFVAAILISSVSYLRAVTAFRKFEWLFFAVLLVFLVIQLGIAKWVKFTFGRNGEE